jgi:3-isopropylmalate/(R)-2-methylmalate dehydratase small subunit
MITGKAAAFAQPNVDTDVIMPKRFLKTITREGLADGAFADLRFEEDGAIRPDFVLNTTDWRDASILVVGNNFGCGSSREHAVWGLKQLGINAVIGTDFGGIFYDNARKNGLALPIVSQASRDMLSKLASDLNSAQFTINITEKTIKAGNKSFGFEMGETVQTALIEGQDETLDTLKLATDIRAFEAANPHITQLRVDK